jgi:hypothetical protein
LFPLVIFSHQTLLTFALANTSVLLPSIIFIICKLLKSVDWFFKVSNTPTRIDWLQIKVLYELRNY